MSANNFDGENVLWMISTNNGEAFLNEKGLILLFKNLYKALLFIRYETDDHDTWQVNEVAVDKDMFDTCEEHGNVI